MNRSEDSWICVADLFAGLMAFFVFVSAGILTSSDNSPGDARANSEFGKRGEMILVNPDDTILLENGVVVPSALFDNNSSELKEGGKERLRDIIPKLRDIIRKNDRKKKILFTGHASCKCGNGGEGPDKNHIDYYKVNMKKSLERAKAVCNYMRELGVLESFEAADIRYRGMSEDMAAKAQPNGICEDRNLPDDEEERFRVVAIELYEEWPVPPLPDYMNKEKIKEKAGTRAVSGPAQSPPETSSEI